MIDESLDFFKFVLVNSVANLRIPPPMLNNQSFGDKFSDGFSYLSRFKFDRSLQQPPLHNTIQCILSLRMLDKISKDLISSF